MKLAKNIIKPFILFLLILGSVNPAYANEIVFTTHFMKPFTWQEDGEFKGFATEIVREMMKIMNHPEKFQMYPFIRGLKEVKSESNRAFFIVARRPEREKMVKWVGPLVSNGVYFYKKKNSSVKLDSLEDLWNIKSIGVERGVADETFLRSKGFNNLVTLDNQKQLLQMLNAERIDVGPMGELVMPEMAKIAGINPNEFERTAIKLYDSEVNLAFSKDVPDHVVLKWQQALDDLKASGKYQEIYQKYLP